MLDRQYHLYSVDTGSFYSNREKYLHNKNFRYHREQKYIEDKLSAMKKASAFSETDPKYQKWLSLMKHKQRKIRESKEKLLALLAHKTAQNETTGGKDHLRMLREDSLNDTRVVSVFDSALSRTIGIEPDQLTDALIVVQIYYFDVFRDLSFYGFVWRGEKYQYFTSSAGQIRKKKAVFIKKSVWQRIEKTVMCGLTVDRINALGGNNVNKHLAYMALTNSATDEWTDFDIDKSIVIDDFETDVYGTFDFVDETDYSITRKTGAIPIPHTDGAGMMLPGVSRKNFMFRAPWIKGLLGVFDFRKFVETNRCSPVITDIYGREHHIINEDIQIIFTKSQFKMYRYYDSWDEYKTAFKKYRCSAGRCNIEEERIKNAKLNYQMLQTLTDVTNEEADLLTHRSAERINNICTSKETMMELLGITPYNTDMNPFQKAVKLYPALLNDAYAKDIIREIKDSLVKKYRSGKLEVTGKYTFLLPDYYAACEYWFGRIKTPKGLLADGEVFCRLFKQYDKLDCLRSPHLYREHAIRQNIASHTYEERAKELGEWFITDGIYAGSHDLISKLLMYDVDGDKALVVADPDFVRIAERNMSGIVPLYYNMRKAEPTAISPQSIYTGLHAAFTGGNIGTYSNHIAKIWNDDVFIHGSESEKQAAMDCIKRLCCQNNFVIDYAKTLYKPEFPQEIHSEIAVYTKSRLPAFFAYAKDKASSQIRERNASLVNRIYERIPDKPINTRGMQLDRLEYQKMMSRETMVCAEEVAALYDKLNRQYRYIMNQRHAEIDNLRYTACKIRDAFRQCGYSDETITDMLVAYLYGQNKRYKQLLWLCYGEQIVRNLEKHIPIKKIKLLQCADCGEWIEVPICSKARRCEKCRAVFQREKTRLRVQKCRQNLMKNHLRREDFT